MTKKRLLLLALLLLVVASLVFSGRRTNPPVENTVAWSSPEAKATIYRACADCHSHETQWPWYSYFAPVSWRVIGHVNEGREHFNISAQNMGEADDAAKMVREELMPLSDYLWLHPEAHLSAQERNRFVTDLQATFGGNAQGGDAESGDGREEHDEDGYEDGNEDHEDDDRHEDDEGHDHDDD